MFKQISAIAKTYANSLFNSDSNYNDVLSDLNTVLDVTKNSKDFMQVMQNPAISADTKFEIIDEVFKNDLSEKVLNFIKILVEKNRFNEFEQIVQAYSDELDKINNLQRVEVISAVELSDNQKQKINEKLQQKLQKNIFVNWVQDKEIIGGLVIKIDDEVIDSSLKNKLEKLSKI